MKMVFIVQDKRGVQKNSKIHYNIAKLIQAKDNIPPNNHSRISVRDVKNIFRLTSVDWRDFQYELLLNEDGYYDLLRLDSLIVMLYKTAIILWPTYEHAMNNLANVLRKRKRPQFQMEAKELLVKALEINSKFSAAWMNLGIVQA